MFFIIIWYLVVVDCSVHGITLYILNCMFHNVLFFELGGHEISCLYPDST